MRYTQTELGDLAVPADLRMLKTISWFLTVELHKQLRRYPGLHHEKLEKEIRYLCHSLGHNPVQSLIAYAGYFNTRHRGMGPVIIEGESTGEWDFGPYNSETCTGLYGFTEAKQNRSADESARFPHLNVEDWV